MTIIVVELTIIEQCCSMETWKRKIDRERGKKRGRVGEKGRMRYKEGERGREG
jgi:hypothetical protein